MSIGPGTVVVGVDGSDTAERALYYAFGMASRQHSRIVAVHAVSTMNSYHSMATVPPVVDTDLDTELEKSVIELADELGISASYVSVAGDPATVILRIAREERADAIIVGASKALAHKLYGSTAVRAVRRCPCPVTVVP
jgi:nucleotide-binding universal stress UspA family protein